MALNNLQSSTKIYQSNNHLNGALVEAPSREIPKCSTSLEESVRMEVRCKDNFVHARIFVFSGLSSSYYTKLIK